MTGVGVSEFGGDTLLVDALPSILGPIPEEPFYLKLPMTLNWSANSRGCRDAARHDSANRDPIRRAQYDSTVAAGTGNADQRSRHDRIALHQSPRTPHTDIHGTQELNKKFGR